MKSLFRICICFLSLLLITNCKSDDDGGILVLTTEGQWLVSALLVESSFDFNMDGVASRDLFQETSCYLGDYIEFYADGEVDIVIDLAYIFVNDENGQSVECQNGFGLTSTWTQNGNTIVVANDDEQGDIVGTVAGNILTVIIPNGFEIEVYNPDTDDIDIIAEDFTIQFIKV